MDIASFAAGFTVAALLAVVLWFLAAVVIEQRKSTEGLMPETHKAKWSGGACRLTLTDGRRVDVEPGDTVEAFEDAEGRVWFSDVIKNVRTEGLSKFDE